MQPPSLSFYHLGIAPKMLNVLEGMKFVVPTPIQHKAIPIALEGKDVVGVAQTGTGKTLAFGIPVAQRLASGEWRAEGRALVLTPTRELAIQVDQVLQTILRPFGFTSVVLIGGVPIFGQIKKLHKSPRVLVATPGRLIDHLDQKTADLRNVHILVLDEADRMFDMGFAPQVERILRSLPRERQTMLFSATMPPDIVNLATRHMKLPVHVEIAPSGTAPEEVTQELFIVKEETKKALLRALLEHYRGTILLFIRTKAKAKKMAKMVRDAGHNSAEIHSDLSMGQRKQAMEGFKSGRYRVLIATDIASRGIDVSGIEVVINYDLPDDIESYVHRIGRTGRAGQTGHAISFATPDQGLEVGKIERLIRKTLPRAAHPEFPQHQFERHAPQVVFSGGPRSRRGGQSLFRRGGRRRY